ncbi:hypothetical protein FGRMN_8341 [Fusarium graminum]|nr:hypothetical protein FGRMN_8341 [Fusarium graminum]
MKGPSHFCEWVVGTTIESALGPIPKNKPPKKRGVVRVEVTTDDESEEDTVKITYPRTGRTNTPLPAAPEATTVIKKVRFEDGPIKSALKQTVITTPVDSSDETSDSAPETESDSSQSETTSSSNATDSDAESSEDSSKSKRKRKKKQKQKHVEAEADTESDWDSDPDPTCKKNSNKITLPSPETSESEEEEFPKPKKQSGKSKKKGAKKEPEPESETSDSAKGTSESEQEATPPPPKKQQRADKQQPKKQGKQKGKKNQQQAVSEPETSESEPEPPQNKKQQKKNGKKGAEKADEEKSTEGKPAEVEGETSESAKETEDEAEPEKSPKQQNKGKQKINNKKQNTKQTGKGDKQSTEENQKAEEESNKEQDVAEVPAAQEEAPATSKEPDQGKFKNTRGKERPKPECKDGVKKGNYPEGLPVPHMRRPQLIEPIRAQVVQTERVIETPEDPAPNAYYDPEHNVMRVYHGPVYGNHQSNALYPDRNAFTRPLPMGQPHPMQNPFYYGFNNPQQYPDYPQMPPYHQNYAGVPPPEAYSHVPITQGMPHHLPWYATGVPPGFYPPKDHREKAHYGNTRTSSKEKAKSSPNNVGPPASLTGENNPYLPKRNKSQFNAWGGSHRSVSKENSQPPGSVKADSNGWNDNNNSKNNNDGGNSWNSVAGDNNGQNDQQGWDAGGQDNNGNNNNQNGGDWGANDNQPGNDWNNSAPETNQDDTWAPVARVDTQQDQNTGWGSGSNKSNETVRKAGDHWGPDTFPGASGSWDEQPKDAVSSVGQGADNNVGVWDTDNANGTEQPSSSQGENGPDNVMPGTWVETPAVTAGPSWGDPTAAQDTNGQASTW